MCLGASLETKNVELLKVGETFYMAIPSEVPKGKRVETWRWESNPTSVGMIKRKSSARTFPTRGDGNESCSVMNAGVTSSSLVGGTTTIPVVFFQLRIFFSEQDITCSAVQMVNRGQTILGRLFVYPPARNTFLREICESKNHWFPSRWI